MASAAAGAAESIGDALKRSRAALTGAGIDSAALDARLLLAAASGFTVEQIVARPERTLDEVAARRLEALLERRLAHEPMAYILGRREFWSLNFTVTPDVLIPRPDSETLIAAVVERLSARKLPRRILDLGTGTGCLLLALLHELPAATGLGVDRSAAALTIAERNATILGLQRRARFCHGNWAHGIDGPFDVVVSNPPYIASAEIATLAPEVQREPRLALDGGDDGLVAYRAIAADLPRVLSRQGFAALEIGMGQAEAVEGILRGCGLEPIARHPDLSGIPRCLLAQRAG